MQIVVTFMGNDRLGLVRDLSAIVHEHGASWQHSQMTLLGGKFGGIALVDIDGDADDARVVSLGHALANYSDEHFEVRAEIVKVGEPSGATTAMELNIVGPDRVGILQEVIQALSDEGIGIERLESSVAPAPMTGGLLFVADAVVELPDAVDRPALFRRLDGIGHELGVDVLLEPFEDD